MNPLIGIGNRYGIHMAVEKQFLARTFSGDRADRVSVAVYMDFVETIGFKNFTNSSDTPFSSPDELGC